MSYNVAIIHVPERPDPKRLQQSLHPLHGHVFTDDKHVGAAWNHRRAIRWATSWTIPTLILEDDAIPTSNLDSKLEPVIYQWLHDTQSGIISLYLGQGAPIESQPEIREKLKLADESHENHITATRLFHAVAYMIRPGITIDHIHKRLEATALEPYTAVDLTIGSMLKGTSTPNITYTIPSLFDHDVLPSTVKHTGQRPTIPRVAWRFEK